MNSEKSYLTPNKVAELLMVSPTTVRQWAEKGDLVALTTPGGHRRFMFSDIVSFARKKGLTLNTPDEGGIRLLIVDDDVQLLRYLQAFFSGYGDDIVVEVVSDGFKAGLKIHEFKPNVVLLDLMMPGMNGFDVCRAIKTEPNTKSIRIIAVTGYPSLENVKQILEAGAEACLSKPVEENVLLEHIGLSVESTA